MRWKLRVEAQLLGDAHPFAVEEIITYPTEHPERIIRDIVPPSENPYVRPFVSDLWRHSVMGG
jgi:hypothetical protein